MKRNTRIIVGVDTGQAWGKEVMRGVMDYLEHHEVWNCHFCLLGPWIGDAVERAPSADGILIDSRFAAGLEKQLKVPGVQVGHEAQGNLPHVTFSYEKIAEMAADHLLSRGFRRFAYYASYGLTPGCNDMGSTFQRRIKEAGCEFERFKIADSERGRWPTGHSQIVRWVKQLKKPVAVMAYGDAGARDLALACRDAGVEVPRGIAILGMSNDELRCFFCRPYLSSIDIGARQAGFQAAELLARLIKGERPPRRPLVVPPVRVIVRESTDIVAAADEHVVAAFRYIENNLARGASVKGMLREVSVGRRTLELKFRKHLGRTIHEEIVRAQLQRAMHLLVHTTSNLEQVGAECGIRYGNHFGTFFKNHMGMTPQQYRMAHRQTHG